MPDELQGLTNRMDRMNEALVTMQGDVRVIKTLVETEGQRCLYREKIDHADRLIPRIQEDVQTLANRLLQIEIKGAAIGGIAGIVTAAITAIIINAIK